MRLVKLVLVHQIRIVQNASKDIILILSYPPLAFLHALKDISELLIFGAVSVAFSIVSLVRESHSLTASLANLDTFCILHLINA